MSLAEKIVREAERKASEILEEARRAAEGIVSSAAEEWKRRAEAARRAIIEDAQRQASIIIADAKREATLIVSRAKQEALGEVFERARALLASREYDVRRSLRNLIAECLAYTERVSKVVVSGQDVEVAREVLRELGRPDVPVEASNDMAGGVIVVSAEGVAFDNTTSTRLKQAELRLLDRIARVLWG